MNLYVQDELRSTIDYSKLAAAIGTMDDFCNSNEILSPLVAARFSKGILNWEGQYNWMSEATYKLLKPGDLPFFEVGDSDYSLVMKPNSENPNAVYDMVGHLIEDSFERFIWRLYYEDPAYYAKNW